MQGQLGEMAAFASIVELLVKAQETEASVDEEGAVWPSRVALYAIMALQAGSIRGLSTWPDPRGGAMIMVPSSSKDYANPVAAADLARYVASPEVTSREQVALLKLAWDLIGSEFAGRHQQYEKFYGGPSFVNKLHMYATIIFPPRAAWWTRR